jgi:hypothetical protein
MAHGGQPKASASTAQGCGCLAVLAVALIFLGAFAWSKLSGGGTTYRATAISRLAVNPATLAVTVRVTDTGKTAGTPSCTINAGDPSGAYSGDDIATLKKAIQPGQSVLFADDLVITHQGARYITQVSVNCS